MNHNFEPLMRCAASAALSLLLVMPRAFAGPGAHGPNGEHLDAPAALRVGPALPRLEAQTETFELVAELKLGELSILIDRYASNEPVLGGRLEVESGALKAVATFRAEQGDYVVTDAALLAALAAPGEHPLVFTLVAGPDSDLLDGTLVKIGGATSTGAGDHGHAHGDDAHHHDMERAVWIGTGVALLGTIVGVAWWRLRHRTHRSLKGAL